MGKTSRGGPPFTGTTFSSKPPGVTWTSTSDAKTKPAATIMNSQPDFLIVHPLFRPCIDPNKYQQRGVLACPEYSKSEARNPKQIQMTKFFNDQNINTEIRDASVLNFEHSNFDIVSDFDIRFSDL